MLRFVVALAAAVALTCSAVSADLLKDPKVSVNTETNQIVDHFGRELRYHGTNMVCKDFPYIPETNPAAWSPNRSLTAKDYAMMQSLGLNIIRLGSMWPGVMPQRGVVNRTYLATMRSIVVEAASYGVSTFLDMHQDVGSRKFCGEGIPVWATFTNVSGEFAFPWPLAKPFATDSNGVPSKADCERFAWAEYYPTAAVSSMWGNLYSNSYGMLDDMTAAWRAISQSVMDIGAAIPFYELLNEPWAGNIYKDLSLLLWFEANNKMLLPAWDHVAAGIRANEQDRIIAAEGTTLSFLGSWFKHVPGGPAWANKSVIAWHFYKPPDFDLKSQSQGFVDGAKRLHAASFLTEYGLSDCPGCRNVLPQDIMDRADNLLLPGWAFWEWKACSTLTGYGWSVWGPNGAFDESVAKLVARTYPPVVAGVAKKILFNRTTLDFELIFAVDQQHVTNSTTEIYYDPLYNYVNGINATASASNGANVQLNISPANRRVYVITPPATVAPTGTLITVKIWSK